MARQARRECGAHRRIYRLTLAQVYSALAYYYDHQTAVDRQIEAERQRYEAAVAKPTQLEQKLKRL